MNGELDRRKFLKSTSAAGAAIGIGLVQSLKLPAAPADGAPPFKISLAEWSFHRMLYAGKLDNLDFPALAKHEFGINCVEYVNVFFQDKARDTAYLKNLKARCEDNGVRSGLIMCDAEGDIGDR